MNKVRSNRVLRVLWMIAQAALVMDLTWNAATRPDPDMPRVILVPFTFVLACFGCLALTVAWVLLYEALRFGLPSLVRRSSQKIHRSLTLRR